MARHNADMSTPPDPGPDVRIGNAERESASQALDEHLSAGRLDPDEYADRMVKVSVARYFRDLEPLFADLPAPHPKASVTKAPVPLAKTSNVPSGRYEGRREALGGRLGEILVALSPFIALALFVGSPWHTWLVFLLIPIAGVLVYGNATSRRHRQ
jgi:hypothetical protein